jgi:hypothetical protein
MMHQPESLASQKSARSCDRAGSSGTNFIVRAGVIRTRCSSTGVLSTGWWQTIPEARRGSARVRCHMWRGTRQPVAARGQSGLRERGGGGGEQERRERERERDRERRGGGGGGGEREREVY